MADHSSPSPPESSPDDTQGAPPPTQPADLISDPNSAVKADFEADLDPDGQESTDLGEEDVKLPWLVNVLDAKVSDFVEWLQDASIVKLAALLSESALLFAVISYVVTIPNRREQTIQDARQVLRQESEHAYSESRVVALTSLNRRCSGNPGLTTGPGAYMPDLELHLCRSFSLKSTWPFFHITSGAMNLSKSRLNEAVLTGAILPGINLEGSNLQGVNLQGANLQGANLRGANLTGADLARIDLQGADLSYSILDGSNLYGAKLQGANFTKASLKNVKALWADIQDANFYDANLSAANLNRTQLQGADFYQAILEKASLRFAQLSNRSPLNQKTPDHIDPSHYSNLLGANLKDADLWGIQLGAVHQLNRAENWDPESNNLQKNWVQQIDLVRPPRLRIALLKPNVPESLFDAYEIGMRRAANRRIEIWAIRQNGADSEEPNLETVIQNADAIIFRPEDTEEASAMISKAQDQGVAIITVDFCLDEAIAKDLVVACYYTNSFEMGEKSGQQLAEWVKRNPEKINQTQDKPIPIVVVDSATQEAYYPYLQGFMAALQTSDLPFKVVDAVSVANNRDNLTSVKEMLKHERNQGISILWGGSNIATETAIAAVEELGLDQEVFIFGILDLSKENAKRLQQDDDPLQLIIDQSGIEIGKQAVKMAEKVLRDPNSGEAYEKIMMPYRLLTPQDKEEVKGLLSDYGSVD